jgi:hypothetical protein
VGRHKTLQRFTSGCVQWAFAIGLWLFSPTTCPFCFLQLGLADVYSHWLHHFASDVHSHWLHEHLISLLLAQRTMLLGEHIVS